MRRFFMFLGLWLVAGGAHAGAFSAALGRYRAAAACQGPAYQTVAAMVGQAVEAYRRAPVAWSVPAGRRAAARLYGLAAVEAAKGCKPIAYETYRFLLRRFDGPDFASWQRRAVRDVAVLRGTVIPPPR